MKINVVKMFEVGYVLAYASSKKAFSPNIALKFEDFSRVRMNDVEVSCVETR
jgi:hypothetical protein